MLGDLLQLAKQRHVIPFWVAMIYLRLGDKEEALRWLEKAYEERSAWLMGMKLDPALDSLRSELRFQALIRRMNFPPQ